ncbi:MAG: type II toxin-antitoxin system PemK/MazF family toxin [Burkholderiales bacterium]|jgi:mRNA interferase MazF|nr:type II toxin-antitoxin system PemK/MazF family toxin [Burkholderiales bacterium]
MGPFATRQVVLLPFPFSDLRASKLRPALVLADSGKGDWVLCQITSNPYADLSAIPLNDADFAQGSLQRVSFARASKIFTAHESLFQRAAGQLTPECHAKVVQVIVDMLQSGG